MSLYTTTESVTEGHPDKVCDQISDAILDAYLKQDPLARVAVETFGAHGLLVLGGEVTSKVTVDHAAIARAVYRDIGYIDDLEIVTRIVQQSPDIACGVDTGGAGDQGIMYGYATDETRELLPVPVVFSSKLTERLSYLRRTHPFGQQYILPDGKVQVTIKDRKVETVVVSVQHDSAVVQDELHAFIRDEVVRPVVGGIEDRQLLVNPTGRFTVGGFAADTGLTGRKIMVDTYGGLIPHGGGAFSGKDPSKVDRSAAYFCRFVAKQVVAQRFAKRALVSVAYAIGKAEPLMVVLETYGTGNVEKGKKYIREQFDFRPRAIIERLGLLRPMYQQTATYGHFSRGDYPWEQVLVS